jgi:predicted DsbA family dithiol-disulfide isomerase
LINVGLQSDIEQPINGGGAVVEIIEYTDPYCTWCWGSEPVLRKLLYVYGDQIIVNYRMGGLVRGIREFYDPLNEIGGEYWYLQVAAHWEDASRRHGMPVDSSVFYEIKDSFTSTYPANIAVKAAELQDRELAKKYLRRLREGAAAERLHIHLPEVQAQLAREVGLDADRLLEDIRSGRAESEFLKDLKECRSMGITGFPTFLVKNLRNGRSALVHGYRRYHYFEGLLEELAGDMLRGREPPETLRRCSTFWRCGGRSRRRRLQHS